MVASHAPDSRRWRPRFSLRALLLFVLLCASGLGLWWRWEPWVAKGEINNFHSNAVFSRDGSRWASFENFGFRLGEQGGDTRHIEFWKQEDPLGYNTPFDIPSGWPLAFSFDNRFLLVDVQPSHKLVLWDLAENRARAVLPGHRIGEKPSNAYQAAFSPDGSRVVTNGTDRVIRVWECETGLELAALETSDPVEWPTWTLFSEDGTRLLSLNHASGWPRLSAWDPATGKVEDLLEFPSGAYVFFTEDYPWIIRKEGEDGVLLNALTGKELCSLPGLPKEIFSRPSITLDGSRVVLCDEGKGGFWSWDTRAMHGRMLFEGFGDMRVAPDGRHLYVQASENFMLYEQRRPDTPWGLLTLPEFWLTPIFAVLLLVSLVRDRHRISASAKGPAAKSETHARPV